MSRPDVPGMGSAVTSWFLLALTALAALLGSGFDVGGPVGAATREVAAADAGSSEHSTAATERATDARVPFVGAVLASAAPAAGAQLDATTSGAPAVVGAPLGVLSQAAAQAAVPSYVVVGGSGRAPPVSQAPERPVLT